MSATNTEFDVVIVGGGPAGLCAAMYCGRGMLRAVLLERGLTGGELLNTEKIEDYPGFVSILGPDLAAKMTEHAVHFGADIRTEEVSSIIRREDGIFEVTCSSSAVYLAPAVILTAGGTPNRLGVPGELEYAGKGVSYCAVCDGAFFKGETIAVIGGGDAAVEEADYLTRYATKVYLIHRRDTFRASRVVQERALANPRIEVIWNTKVLEMVGANGALGPPRTREHDQRHAISAARDGGLHLCRVYPQHRAGPAALRARCVRLHHHQRPDGDIDSGALCCRRPPGSAHAPGDHRGGRCHHGRHRRREVPHCAEGQGRLVTAPDVLGIANGMFEENTWLVWDAESRAAVVIDPGEECSRILREISARDLRV